ncbi:MAG: VWA domain-containing protein [Acidimicrobiia bacterium]
MIGSLSEFVSELRAIGIPVSMVEALDAIEAIEHTDLGHPEHLRATLGATLVKSPRHYDAFDAAFDVFFGLRSEVGTPDDDDPGPGAGGSGGSGADGLPDGVYRALVEGDIDALRALIARAVDHYAGMQPGRPVGGRYYAYRVLRRLESEHLLARLIAALVGADLDSEIESRIQRAEVDALIELLRSEIDREVTARLVADRGAAAVAASRRVALIEDIDLMHATQLEIEKVSQAIGPLARKLATRLSHRRRRGRVGRLDVRRTIRRSLAHGGVLLEPSFKPPRVSKPEFVVLCDLSGSMATFARFTMQLAYAISSELSKVRVFAFIDALDEVTDHFGPGSDFGSALLEIGRVATLVKRDGHSDYGSSFADMWERYGDAVTSKSTVIVTGDARNNYRDPGIEYLDQIAQRCRALFWLNPEPERFWDTGDSVMSRYALLCDRVEQVRTLRQLEGFVERAALPVVRRSRLVS